MKINEATWDRAVRVIAGLLLIGLAISGKIGLWAYVGVVPLITGIVGHCPMYSMLGINTCSLRRYGARARQSGQAGKGFERCPSSAR